MARLLAIVLALWALHGRAEEGEILSNRALAATGLAMTYTLEANACSWPEGESADPFFSEFGFARSRRQREIQASAIPLDDAGHLVTVAIDGACTRYLVTRPDGSTFEADLVAWDETSTVGVLASREPTSAPTFGDSDALQPGDAVWVFGTAYKMSGTIGHGVVSTPRRYLNDQFESHFIQTDAPTHQGQSGGPVLDAAGHVVGLNAYILARGGRSSFDGLAFALPISSALRITSDLLEHGEYVAARLGVDIQTGDDGTGVYIAEVDEDGPSAELLQEGDRVVAVDGHTVLRTEALTVPVRLHRPGDAIALRIDRGGERMELEIVAAGP